MCKKKDEKERVLYGCDATSENQHQSKNKLLADVCTSQIIGETASRTPRQNNMGDCRGAEGGREGGREGGKEGGREREPARMTSATFCANNPSISSISETLGMTLLDFCCVI